MREVDLSIVTYEPDLALLSQLLDSLAEPLPTPVRLTLLVQDNSPAATTAEAIRALPELKSASFARVDVVCSGANLGFGLGHNANAARGKAPWFLVLNQDCILEPGALAHLIDTAARDDARVAAWELRQIPYEHPKGYDPVTMQTPWVSGAASLFRRGAFDEAGGFEPRIFMYGEDVDLSWRLRANGWRLHYVPRAGIVHRTYATRAEVKPLQVLGGVYANLCLRLRYGGGARTLQGLAMLGAEILAPQSFPGRRWGLAKAGMKFFANAPYFFATRVLPSAHFHPHFAGWSYEVRRDGAFHAFTARRGAPPRSAAQAPLVSILIRTVNRQAWLRQALASCANQTYEPIEVIVVEDGPASSRAVVEEFSGRLNVRYHATGEKMGRAGAGNQAMALAQGTWFNFLDDDDVFFADHVEVLVDSVLKSGLKGAYALAWETQTDLRDQENADYEEVMHLTRHHQRFDRLTLWHHNYLPIQAVLFHRSLYERHGGFAQDMDQLEDWNLWTRYTLEDDFLLVEKTTSKYRVPFSSRVAAERQTLLDHAYADALERQRQLRVTMSPRAISEMADSYARGQAVMMVTRNDVRRFVGSRRWLSRLFALRRPGREWLRRRGIWR